MDDTFIGYLAYLSALKLDQIFVESAFFYTRSATGSLRPLTPGVANPELDLILGYDLLKPFRYFILDYRDRSIIIGTTHAYTPKEQNLVARASLREVKGTLAAAGVIDGVETNIIIDCAGDYALALPDGSTSTVTQLSLGELVARTVTPIPLEQGWGDLTYPRVGKQLLEKYTIAVDNKRKLIYFERPYTRSQK